MAIFKDLTVKGEIDINGNILQDTVDISKKYGTILEMSGTTVILKSEDGTELSRVSLTTAAAAVSEDEVVLPG